MKKLLLVLILILIPSSVYNQTVSQTLQYDYLASTLVVTNTYTTSLKIDTAAPIAITPTCVTNGANVRCTNPITLTSGNHTIIVTVINTSGVSATGTLNYVPGLPPSTPSNITITIQVTIP